MLLVSVSFQCAIAVCEIKPKYVGFSASAIMEGANGNRRAKGTHHHRGRLTLLQNH